MALERDEILERIRQARKEAGLTQEEAAAVLGVHKRTIENYEHVRVPWRRLHDLAQLYGKPPDWFLQGNVAANGERLPTPSAGGGGLVSDEREMWERLMVHLPDLMVPLELAGFLRRRGKWVLAECRAGRIPSVKVGQEVRIPKPLAIEYLVESGKERPNRLRSP